MGLHRSITALGLAAIVGVALVVASATLSGQAAGATCDPARVVIDGAEAKLPDIGQDRAGSADCPLPDGMPPPPNFAPAYGPIDMLLVPDYMPVANEHGEPMLDAFGVEMCMRTNVRPAAPPAIPVNGPDPAVGEDIEGHEWPTAPGASPLVPCPPKG